VYNLESQCIKCDSKRHSTSSSISLLVRVILTKLCLLCTGCGLIKVSEDCLFPLLCYTPNKIWPNVLYQSPPSIQTGCSEIVSAPGLGLFNVNPLKNSLNSCQIFRLLKFLTNISNCIHVKQF
jgi:hypothetical protein